MLMIMSLIPFSSSFSLELTQALTSSGCPATLRLSDFNETAPKARGIAASH